VTKNIISIECFGVFLQMRAFADIESRLAAAPVVFPQRRTAEAAATLVRIHGEISPAEVVWPMCRPQICERRKWPLPPPWPNWHFDGRHRETVSLDASLQPDLFGLTGPVRRIRHMSVGWPRKLVDKPAARPSGQMSDSPHADIVSGHGLLASLILRQVRAQGSGGDAEQLEYFSDDRTLSPLSGLASEVVSTLVSRAGRPTPAATDSPDSPKALLETQLAELAWRRVRGLRSEGRAK